MYSMMDPITRLERLEDQDSISSNGSFELELVSLFTQQVKLKIGQATLLLYVEPDYVYGLSVPELDPAYQYNNDSELLLDFSLFGSDSTELNALIWDYQSLYNRFFAPEDQRFLSRPQMFRRADSLQCYCDLRYKDCKNPWFLSYVRYSIASINASVSRGENYLINTYIFHKPILYGNKAYMDFFNSCFTGYLNSASTAKQSTSLYYLINNSANYEQLSAYFKTDRFLSSDTLRELVILHNLWQYCFSPDYNTAAIKQILSQIQAASRLEEHRAICRNMLAYLNKLLVGSEAPQFSARAANGKMGSLQQFKGKWVYLNFFSTRNEASLKEMPKLAALKKKYGQHLVFLSICLDDSLSAYTAYLRANPKFDWPIWFNSAKGLTKTAKEHYFVSGTEAYFLISKQGDLSLCPAPSPSQGIEYRFNLLFKPKRRNTKTGIR